jgi:FKBP-type peptidyl-prolyl cis-trans isomerase FklB
MTAQSTPKPADGRPSAARSGTRLSLKNDREKESYAVDMNIGMNLQKQGADVDLGLVALGLKDSMAGRKTLMTEDEMKAAIQELQNEGHINNETKMQEAAGDNRKQGDAFLIANKTKQGVLRCPADYSTQF